MKKIVAFFGFVVVCNAASLHVIPAGRTIFHAAPSVVPSIIRSVEAPAPVVSSFVQTAVPSVLPVSVSDVELSDWEAYKEKFGKKYVGLEDRLRRNLYFATKTRVATHNKLFENGLAAEQLQLDIFADFTRDEIFSLRSILDEDQDEWNDYKLKYGKIYDNFEDRFRKTVYFIRKETIEDCNKLFENGLSSYAQGIDSYTDCFDDEYSSGYYMQMPAPAEGAVEVPAVDSRALVPSTFRYSFAHPYAAVQNLFPRIHQRAFYY